MGGGGGDVTCVQNRIYHEDASTFIGVSNDQWPPLLRAPAVQCQHVRGQKVTCRGGCDGTRRVVLPRAPLQGTNIPAAVRTGFLIFFGATVPLRSGNGMFAEVGP